ncbi:hypothetical protein THAOC_26420, partial [Thalassiosira oceanica]
QVGVICPAATLMSALGLVHALPDCKFGLEFWPPRTAEHPALTTAIPAKGLLIEEGNIQYGFQERTNYFPYNFCVARTRAVGTSKLTSQHFESRTSTAF